MSEFSEVVQAVTGAYARLKDAESDLAEAMLALRGMEERARHARVAPRIPNHLEREPGPLTDSEEAALGRVNLSETSRRVPPGGEWRLDPISGVGYFRADGEDGWHAFDLRSVLNAADGQQQS